MNNGNNSATKIQLIQSGMKLTGPAYSNNKCWMNGMETTKQNDCKYINYKPYFGLS